VGPMNYSIYGADRATHLKIVVLALVASIGLAGFAISARIGADEGYWKNARAIKAGPPSLQAERSASRCLPGRSLCST
jgi:hypothetical protein